MLPHQPKTLQRFPHHNQRKAANQKKEIGGNPPAKYRYYQQPDSLTDVNQRFELHPLKRPEDRESEPPETVTILLQLTLGSALGARFAGYSLGQVGKIMLLSVIMAFLMLVVTLVVSGALSYVFDLEFEALILALSPGGFAEMTLAALSMGIDPAFVTTHHALRLLVIVFIVPLFLSRIIRKKN